jgi:hypothetical protein
MSNRLIKTTPGPGWSLPVDRPTTRALHERFASAVGVVDVAAMKMAFSIVGRLRNLFFVPMEDGYPPFIGGTFGVGVGAQIAIAFPSADDKEFEDGTMTDRAVSVHTMGAVADDVLDELIIRLTEALPKAEPAPAPEWPRQIPLEA